MLNPPTAPSEMMSYLPMTLFAAFFVLCTLTIFIYNCLCRLPLFSSHPTLKHSSLSSIRTILSSMHTSLNAQLLSRALANRRLAHAFKLTNTFVSQSTDVRGAFRTEMEKLLREFDYQDFARICVEAVDASLADSGTETPQQGHTLKSIRFDDFVQEVSLRAVLVGLLKTNRDVEELKRDDLKTIAWSINWLWKISKPSAKFHSDIDPNPEAILQYLMEALHRVIPDRERYPNPIDFIVPTYETLWRVVASTIAFANDDISARRVFAAFLDSPHKSQFRARSFIEKRLDIDSEKSSSIQDFIFEAMRLCPPSKRISRASITWIGRQFPLWLSGWILTIPILSWLAVDHIDAADIEALHLSQDIWGCDALDFQPSRHHPSRMNHVQKGALLPFGYGPTQCLAKNNAPMMVGLVAGAILNRIDGCKYYLSPGECIGSRDGWDGWRIDSQDDIRHDYE